MDHDGRTGVLVKLTAQPGLGDALAAHLGKTVALARTEPGTELFIVHRAPDDADVVWLYEVYASDAARAAHEASDGYKAAKAGTSALLGGPPDVFPLLPVEGKGLL